VPYTIIMNVAILTTTKSPVTPTSHQLPPGAPAPKQLPAAREPNGKRVVHAAMAASVAEGGSPEAQALYTLANTFNLEYFAGTLTALLVEITAPASPRALATHEPRTREGVDCVIRIAPGVVAEGPKTAADVLLHEMIHVWQTETGNREPGYQGHGPKFAAKCNEIGAKLGLPPVAAKGRGPTGQRMPDCAQWPLNVRPAGYYGQSGPVAKAQTRAARKGEGGEGGSARTKKTKVEKVLTLLADMSPEELAEVVAYLGAAGVLPVVPASEPTPATEADRGLSHTEADEPGFNPSCPH
jgi:hypothetical protein